MLSLLEHIGSRKIMASRAMTVPGHDILKHLAEETRHVYTSVFRGMHDMVVQSGTINPLGEEDHLVCDPSTLSADSSART